MTNNIIPHFKERIPAEGFNPFGLTDDEVGDGWRLLEKGDQIQPLDGFYHELMGRWLAFECRPDIFHRELEYVHTTSWRRKI